MPEKVVPEVYGLPRVGRAVMFGVRGVGLAGAIALAGCGAGAPAAVSDPTTDWSSSIMLYGSPPLVEAWEPYPHPIAFAPGSDELDEAAREVVTAFIRDAQVRMDIRAVRLEGFAHGAPSGPSGLGSRRAAAVASALVAMGMPQGVIQVMGAQPHPDAGEARDEVVITLLVVR